MKSTLIYFKVILFYLCSMALFATSNAIFHSSKFPELFSLIFAVFLTSGLIYIFIRWDKISLMQIGLGYQKNWLSRFVAGFCIGAVMIGVMALIITCLTPVIFERSPTFRWSQCALYIPLFLFVALREELVFRTYILWRLKDKIGPILSLICVTVIFIAEHMMAGLSLKNSLIGSGLGALLFGIATLRTGNIALSAGLHFAWNSMHWMSGFKDNTGLYIEIVPKDSESSGEIVAYIAYSAVMLLGIITVILLFRPQKNG